MKMTIMIPKIPVNKRKRVKNVKPEKVKKRDVRKRNERRMKVKRKVMVYVMKTMPILQQLRHHQNVDVSVKMLIKLARKKKHPHRVNFIKYIRHIR